MSLEKSLNKCAVRVKGLNKRLLPWVPSLVQMFWLPRLSRVYELHMAPKFVNEADLCGGPKLEPWNDNRMNLDVGSPELLSIVGLGGCFSWSRNLGNEIDTTWGGKKVCFYGSVVGELLHPILKYVKPVYIHGSN